MKKMHFKLFVTVLALFLINSCNEPLVEDYSENNLELKSANSLKTSYIVLLNDADLNTELLKLKGYEKKQAAVKAVSAKILNRVGIVDGEIEHVYGTAVKGFSIKIPPGQLKKLQDDLSVVKIYEDKLVSLVQPKNIKVAGDVSAQSQEIPWGIIRVNGGADGTGKTAWIIDTGIDLDHPDLDVDASRGETFVTRTKSADDDNGHGSHVAGTIAALNNGEGVIGVAAGATVVPVKVLDKRGSGYYSWIIAGVDFVAEHGSVGDVANMSLGGGFDEELNDVVISAAQSGVMFALAAGNEGTDANTKSPASAEHVNIYTISAMDSNDDFAYFSNYGNPPVDFCEPGVSIYSCYKGGAYATMSGTSMAAPHMAGLLLLGFENLTYIETVNGDPDGNPDSIAVYDGTVTPPENYAPTANAGPDQSLTDIEGDGELVVLDGSGSSDDNGITSYVWTYEGYTIPDGETSEVTLGIGIHTVTLTVSDGEFTDTDGVIIEVKEPVLPGDIVLSASVRKVRGVRYVDLEWSGAVDEEVEIFKDGASIGTTPNNGFYTVNLGRVSGTFTFKVCETEGSGCSNEATATI